MAKKKNKKENIKKQSTKKQKLDFKTINVFSKLNDIKNLSLAEKIVLFTLILVLIIILFVSISYAYWLKDVETKEKNTISTGCFSYELTDANSINLLNTYPITEEEAMKLTPYTFTITNNCSINMEYNVTLNTKQENLLDENVDYVLINETDNTKIGPERINTMSKYADYNNYTYIDDKETFNIVNSYILTEGVLKSATLGSNKEVVKAGETKSYKLYLWVDEEATNDTMGLSFEAKVIVTSKAINSLDDVIDKNENSNKYYTIVTDNNENGKADIGDEIAVGDEHFYVISNDGETLNALAKYNLNAGNMCSSASSCTPIENPTYKQDEAMTGFKGSYGHGSLKFSNTNGWPYSNNDTIDIQAYDGPVKTAINAYKEILPEGIEVRLITKAEIEALVNDGATLSSDSIKDKADAKGVSWLYSTSYWSGSADAGNAGRVWYVRSVGTFGDYGFDNVGNFGVRPVIEIAE